MNYNNKIFKVVSNSENGELGASLIFHYKQDGRIISCTYSDENIKHGQLLGLVDANGQIKMSYHQINADGELMSGTCQSIPEILDNGKIRLHETWQWTSGDKSKGSSTLEEI